MNNKKTKLALVIAGIFAASTVSATNLITNPRFEADEVTATGWNDNNGRFTVGHDETDEANTARNGNHNGTDIKSNFAFWPNGVSGAINQDITGLEPGARYRLSVLVRAEAANEEVDPAEPSGVTNDMWLIVRDQTNNVLIRNRTINVTSQDGWIIKTLDFIALEGETHRVVVYKQGAAGNVSIDNFDLRKVEDDNLIKDAAFESGSLDTWLANNDNAAINGDVTIVDNTVAGDENNTYRGQYAAKITQAAAWASNLRQDVFLKPDTDYEVSFYAKRDPGSDAIVNIKTDLANGGPGSQGFSPNIIINSDDWELYTHRFTTATDMTDCDAEGWVNDCTTEGRALNSFFWLGGAGAGTFYIDNINLREISNTNPNLFTDPSFEAADRLSV